MTLTESTNICYISDTVACTVKLNIKDTFLGSNIFPENVYIVNELQSEIKRSITWRIFYLVREGRIPVTLSPLWEILGLMLMKIGVIEFGHSWIHQNYFWNFLRQTSKFFGMKFTTDVALLFFSAVDNNSIFVYFLCHKYGLWN